MNKEEYRIYLQSDHWKKLRQLKLEQSGRQCKICESKENIDVHHLQYHNIYDVCLGDLQVLCRFCHKLCHSFKLNRFGKRCRKYNELSKKRIKEIKELQSDVSKGEKKRDKRQFKIETRRLSKMRPYDIDISQFANK